MKQKIFILILSLLTIICIIFGAYRHLRFSSTSSKAERAVKKSLGIEKDWDFGIDEYDDEDEESFDSLEMRNVEELKIEEFSEIDIDGTVLAVVVERGRDFSVSEKYSNKKLKPSYSIKNGKLYIKQPDSKKVSVVGSNGNCKIVISVPYGVVIKRLDASINVGAMELKGFDIQEGSISTNVGAISIEDMDFEKLTLRSNVGAVAVDLMKDIADYSIDVKSDVGGIVIGGKNVKRKYSQDGNTGKKLTIKTDVGGIEIK